MNQKLYEFANLHFYENKMLTRTRILPDEKIMNNLPFPNKDFPSFFYNVLGKEETENKSYFNMDEVRSVFKCVNKLVENKIELKNIGVITFYSAQKQKFYEELYTKEKYYDLKIDTIDGFQGMEMDYIIISTVRNNLLGILGFLKSQKRLNVSLIILLNNKIILNL
jgi:senataxin